MASWCFLNSFVASALCWKCATNFFAAPIAWTFELIIRLYSTQSCKQCTEKLRLWPFPDCSQSISPANYMFEHWSCITASKWLISILYSSMTYVLHLVHYINCVMWFYEKELWPQCTKSYFNHCQQNAW